MARKLPIKKNSKDTKSMINDQSMPAVAQTDSMLADGGMMEEGGAVDPVSGNDVPTGSLKEEVRDDIDASLSPGEFVLPADVVRYIGLEKLMKIRDAAKEGLKRMEEVGQMGNAEEAPKANEAFEEDDDEFNSSIDEIMSEVDNEEQTVKMAAGGFMSGQYTEGMKFNPVVDVRYFKHSDGRVIYVTYINDKPLTAIPEGFTQTDTPVEQKVGKEAEDAAAAAAARANAGAGSGGGGGTDNAQPIDARTAAFFDKESDYDKEGRMLGVNSFLQTLVNAVVPGMGLINALPSIISSPVVGAIANTFGTKQDPNLVTVEDAVPRSVADIRGQTESPFNREEAVRQFAQESFRASEIDNMNAAAEAASRGVTVGGPIADQPVTGTPLGPAPDTTTPDTGGGGYNSGDYGGYSGSETQSSGESYANYKGGFIKKKKNVVKSKRGLASR